MKNTFIFSFFIFAVLLSISAEAKNKEPQLPVVQQPIFKQDTFNIVTYGAKNDGITLNTKSINDAIADCNKKRRWCSGNTSGYVGYRPH